MTFAPILPAPQYLTVPGDIFNSLDWMGDRTVYWVAPPKKELPVQNANSIAPEKPCSKGSMSEWGFQSEASEGCFEIPAQLP